MIVEKLNKEDFERVLSSEKGWKLNNLLPGEEYIYEFALTSRPYIVIRVLTSVSKKYDNRRPYGKDAIRVFAFNERTKKGWIKTKRVYRTLNWEVNLKKTIIEIFHEAQNRT
jgi:hypothetical protein